MKSRTEAVDWNSLVFYDESSPSRLAYHAKEAKGRGASRRYEGEPAGTFDKCDGYYRLRHEGKSYLVHRVIVCMRDGSLPDYVHVDHEDRNRTNNVTTNLRTVTPVGNMYNKSLYASNRSGLAGVLRRYIEKKGYGYFYYVAGWTDSDGKKRTKAFSCNKYGEDGANKLAIEYRAKMVEENPLYIIKEEA